MMDSGELQGRRAEFVYNAARLAGIAAGAPVVPVPWDQRETAFNVISHS